MKSRLIASVLAVGVATIGLVAHAAVTDQEASPLPPAQAELATFSVGPDGATVIEFAARYGAYGNYAIAEGVANVGVASGAFVGSYTQAGVQALKFKFATDGHVPGTVAVTLVTAGPRVWYTTAVNVSDVPGVFVSNTIGFTLADGWDRNCGRKSKAACWAAALEDVDALGIRLAPGVVDNDGDGRLDAETYMIKDFMLVGADGVNTPGELSPLAKRLFGRFGVTKMSQLGSMGQGDRDGDGMSDLEETLVGTDDNDAADLFTAEVLDTTDDGVKIKWTSAVADASYKVFRADALVDAFGKVAEVTIADVAVVDGDSVWVDTSADPSAGPYFYKVLSVIPEEE